MCSWIGALKAIVCTNALSDMYVLTHAVYENTTVC